MEYVELAVISIEFIIWALEIDEVPLEEEKDMISNNIEESKA